MSDNFFDDMEVISAYTAEQAVEDGVLVEVDSDLSKEAGFNFTVRITNSVHELCTPPKSNKIQSYKGRLWDVLWMAYLAIRKSKDDGFVEFVVRIGKKNVKLWAMIDGTSGPAIHIMLPEDY